MSVIVNFAMFPTDKGESASPYVSKIIKRFDGLGVEYKLSSMGTNFETETLEEALDIINKAYKELEPDCGRVYSAITMDIRKGGMGRMNQKIKSVESRIGVVNK